ncbi:MAG: VCBS repeat-containing protein [Deltaproteobacteria bacterium]|nr:VCBS repeat-containing protein [Deltaproteobacteria bacterium]
MRAHAERVARALWAAAVAGALGCGARSALEVWGAGGEGTGGGGGGGTGSGDCADDLWAFAPTGWYAAGNTPKAIVGGDFDGDGDLDLAVANSGATGEVTAKGAGVSVHLNQGEGVLAPPLRYAEGANYVALAAGDVDRDGDLDLVPVQDGACVDPLEGMGDGTFQGFV